jgi:hypothetical protein
MTGALLRRLIARDRVFVAVRIRSYGKVEAGTRHSAGQMITENASCVCRRGVKWD